MLHEQVKVSAKFLTIFMRNHFAESSQRPWYRRPPDEPEKRVWDLPAGLESNEHPVEETFPEKPR
jgi:hypothetical protein